MCLAERFPAPCAQAGQVRLLGAQVLAENDLLPFVLEEHRGERQPGVGCCLRPPLVQRPLVGDGRGAPGLLDDAVGEPVHVEDLDTAADSGVLDEQGELRVQGLGQVPGVRGQQDRRSRLVCWGCRAWLACLFRQEGRAVQGGDGLSGSGAPGHLGWT